MTRKTQQQKVVQLHGQDNRYAGPGLYLGDDRWMEEIGPFTNDGGVLHVAHGAVEAHTTAWLVYFTSGETLGLWKPPVVVLALGLDYATDRKKSRVWQVEGMALIEAMKLTETVADVAEVMTADYRTSAGRAMRQGSRSAERAKAWCQHYEHLQDQQGRYDRPPVGMPLPNGKPSPVTMVAASQPVAARPAMREDSEVLRFYRELLVNGEVSG